MRRGRPDVSSCFPQVYPVIQTSRDGSHENPRRPLVEWKFTVDVRNLLAAVSNGADETKMYGALRFAENNPFHIADLEKLTNIYNDRDLRYKQKYSIIIWEIFYLSKRFSYLNLIKLSVNEI